MDATAVTRTGMTVGSPGCPDPQAPGSWKNPSTGPATC
jgi:hypothetical protein